MLQRLSMAAAAILVSVGVGVAVAFVLIPGDETEAAAPELTAGTALVAPQALADFHLLDQTGRTFDRRDLEGSWSLLFAGFTHCPDACPATLALLSRIQKRLEEHGRSVRIVFLSVDPERDTPEQLARYVGYFGEGILAATGERAEIDALAGSLGLAYVRIPGSEGHYSFDHSTAVVLIDPAARMAGYFRPPLDPDDLERDLRRL